MTGGTRGGAQGAGGPVVLFLAGLGRSGTTLLERAVGETPGVVALGEVVHLWHRGLLGDELCGCREPFSRCPFWREVGERAFGGWEAVDAREVLRLRARVDRTRFVPELAGRAPSRRLRADVAAYTSSYRRLYEAAAEVAGAEVVVDSSKHTSLAFCLRHDPAVRLRVVQCVRDSRGVAHSWARQVQRPEARGGADLMTRYGPVRAAVMWDAHNLALELLARRGVPVHRLRYEDFLRAPRDAVQELLTLAGASGRPDHVGASAVHLSPAHTVAGNPMRFLTGTVELRHDVAWRSQMPVADRRVVEALTAPLLAHYRYPVRGGR